MMTIHRRAAKRDTIATTIIQALRGVGAQVWQVSGKGIPDLLVLFRGEFYLLEVKTGRGKLTPAQVEFFDDADTPNAAVVRSVDDALQVIGAIDAT
jgi:hypothetical protein